MGVGVPSAGGDYGRRGQPSVGVWASWPSPRRGDRGPHALPRPAQAGSDPLRPGGSLLLLLLLLVVVVMVVGWWWWWRRKSSFRSLYSVPLSTFMFFVFPRSSNACAESVHVLACSA